MKNKITKRQTLLRVLPVIIGAVGLGAANLLAAPLEETSAHEKIQDQEPRARMSDKQVRAQTDSQAVLEKATDVYQAMVKGTHGQVPESVLTKAQCIVVIPEVKTGALVVGGTFGSGIVSCRENNAWSQPAFLKLQALSFGAQIGGKSSDLVLFMVSEAAKATLKKGNIALGSDVSVTAGKFDRAWETSQAGVVAYTRTEGAFAGASLSGGTISADDGQTAAMWGDTATFATLLGGGAAPQANAAADRFIALLPQSSASAGLREDNLQP